MEVEKTRQSVEEERREYNELLNLLVGVQKDYVRSNKIKDIIIIILIACMFLEAAVGYAGFIWYESQFGTEETTTTTTTEVYTEGDNANAEYNHVEGDQYNDESVHNEGLKKNE